MPIRQGLELKTLTEEMLRLNPLLTLRSKLAYSQTASHRSLSPQSRCPPGIDVTDTVSTFKT